MDEFIEKLNNQYTNEELSLYEFLMIGLYLI